MPVALDGPEASPKPTIRSKVWSCIASSAAAMTPRYLIISFTITDVAFSLGRDVARQPLGHGMGDQRLGQLGREGRPP